MLVPNFVTFFLFMKSQFTPKFLKYHPPELMHSWICLITDCRTISRSQGGFEWFYRLHNCPEVST